MCHDISTLVMDVIFKTNVILYFIAHGPGLSSYKGPLARWFGNFILKVPFPSPGIMANLTQLHQPEPERSTGAGVNVVSSVFFVF